MAVVIITGANSGFGLQGTLAFARTGDTVVATMRNTDNAKNLVSAASSEGLSIDVTHLDVTRPETFSRFVADVNRKHARIDVLVNNAGTQRAGSLEDIPEESLRSIIETNTIAPLLLTKAVLPSMRDQGSGYIINMSSLSGIAGIPGDVVYTASKFALEGATEALRHEVDRWGIHVGLVLCGMYATGLFDATKTMGELLPPDYPVDSPYRSFIARRLKELHERLPDALDPVAVGNLFVEIARSDGSRLRWAADELAERVLATVFSQDDAARDRFLREVGGSDWWSNGDDAPISR